MSTGYWGGLFSSDWFAPWFRSGEYTPISFYPDIVQINGSIIRSVSVSGGIIRSVAISGEIDRSENITGELV